MGQFDPPVKLPPLTDPPKNCRCDYVTDIYRRAKFHEHRFRGFVSTHARLCAPSVYSVILSSFGGLQVETVINQASIYYLVKYSTDRKCVHDPSYRMSDHCHLKTRIP